MSRYVHIPPPRSGTPTASGLRGASNVYVSTTGNDTTGNGSLGSPWLTISKALTVAASSSLSASGDTVINVRAGEYALTSTLSVGVPSAAKAGSTITIYSVDGPGQARVTSAARVTGFTNFSGNIWRAAVSGNFWTVYKDGVRLRPARSPKLVVNASFPVAKAPYYISDNNGSSFTAIQYKAVDFNPAAYALADLQVYAWVGGSKAWLADTHSISARDTVAHTLTYGDRDAKFYSFSTIGSRYFVQGVIDLLTEAGEFYHDAANGFLYLYGDPTGSTVIVPRLGELLSVTGASATSRASGVVLDGMSFEYTDFFPGASGTFRFGYPSNGAGTVFGPGGHTDLFYAYWDSIATARNGAVTIQDAQTSTIRNCKFSNIGGNGLYMGGCGYGHGVSNSLFEHLGVTGIVQEGRYSSEGDVIGGSTFYNVKINNMGELAGGSTGLQIGNSGSNIIKNCAFTDGPRHGLWLYGSFNQPFGSVYTRNNTVDHCKFERLCQDSGDTAGLYMESFSSIINSGNYNTNTFSQIIVSGCNAHPSMTDAAPDGVFTDNQTSGQVFSNVQVSSVGGNLIRIQADSGNHTATNCSFTAAGAVNGSFNAGLMDTANIGVTSSFPY